MDGHGTGPSTRPPRKHKPLQPLLNIVDGKPVVERMGPLAGFLRFLAEPFTSAWRHRDLIIAILGRELRERFKGSAAGWVWAVVAPLLSLITYTAFFGGSIKLPNNATSNSSVDYGLFIFGGLIAYNFFSEMAYRAPSLLHEYSHYIKQTMFPAEMLAIISTLRATTYAAIALVLMLACQLVFTGSLHWTVLLLPLWFIPFLAFLIGLTWLLSAMGAFTRDTSYLMMTIAPLMMFATPVFFAQESLSPTMSLVLYANILTGYIEIIRDIVVFGQVPAPLVCLWTLFLSGLTFWFGYWFFCKRRDGIADVI
jgi:lipopolysaccharide transport system permease protein